MCAFKRSGKGMKFNMKNKKSKKRNGKKIFIILLLIVLIISGTLFYMNYIKNTETPDISNNNTYNSNELASNENKTTIIEVPIVEKEVQIYKGIDRPFAVMIDNHDDARPQVAINKAYVVYEIIVEGGYTRMMPIFKGQDIEKIGPVRSARHYFLDYALENDAIYVHFGQSPQAGSDIQKLNIDDIDGIYYSESQFKRTSGKYAPHNVIVSTDVLKEIAKNKGYRTTSDEESVLKYNAEKVELDTNVIAEEVFIPFSKLQDVTFKYDEDKEVYVKYANDEKQVDWVSKEDVTFKNIILTFAENYTLNDAENKGRQGLLNTGEKKGYYITNGKAIEITCTKSSRASKTVYKDLDGNEIEVNDGNTYIGICPLNAKVEIEPGEEIATNVDNENIVI